MPELVEEVELEQVKFSKDIPPVANNSRHYIDDAKLTQILSEWKKIYDAAKAAGEIVPRLPESVGAAIYDMSEAMGKRFNFSNYSYLDEMKSKAILHCVKYIHNFNPEKKSEKKGKVSAFGYINMIIWRSFTNCIKEEKQEQYFKYKSFELMGGHDAFKDEEMESASGEDEGEYVSIGALGSDFMQKAREYEEKYMIDKVKKEKKSIVFDNFMFDMSTPPSDVEEDVPEEFQYELDGIDINNED
jgi:hypothetical protein